MQLNWDSLAWDIDHYSWERRVKGTTERKLLVNSGVNELEIQGRDRSSQNR